MSSGIGTRIVLIVRRLAQPFFFWEPDIDIRQALHQIADELGRRPDDTPDASHLRICAINTGSAGELKLSLYSMVTRILIVCSRRRQARRAAGEQAMRELLNCILQDKWGIQSLHNSMCRMTDYAYPLTAKEAMDAAYSVWKPKWPSLSLLPSELTESVQIQGVLAPCARLKWAWPKEHRPLKDDLAIYIGQPYTTRPAMDTMRVLVYPEPGSVTKYRIVLLTSSRALLMALKRSYNWSFRQNKLRTSVGGLDELYSFFCYVLMEQYKYQSAYCLQHMARRVVEVASSNHFRVSCPFTDRCVSLQDLKARRRALAPYVNYLLHLKEYAELLSKCSRSNVRALLHQLELLSPLPLPEETAAVVYPAIGEIQLFAKDMLYLGDEFAVKAAEIQSVVEAITLQMEVHGRTRAYVLTIMVAIYAPLAFVSSVFGMNLPDTSTNMYWTNTSSSTNESVPVNSTWTITDQPGNVSWEAWKFAAIGVPLTIVSVILPLTAGPLTRFGARAVSKVEARWMTTLPWIGFLGMLVTVHAVSIRIALGGVPNAFTWPALHLIDALQLSWALAQHFLAILQQDEGMHQIWFLPTILFFAVLSTDALEMPIFPLSVTVLAMEGVACLYLFVVWIIFPQYIHSLFEYLQAIRKVGSIRAELWEVLPGVKSAGSAPQTTSQGTQARGLGTRDV